MRPKLAGGGKTKFRNNARSNSVIHSRGSPHCGKVRGWSFRADTTRNRFALCPVNITLSLARQWFVCAQAEFSLHRFARENHDGEYAENRPKRKPAALQAGEDEGESVAFSRVNESPSHDHADGEGFCHAKEKGSERDHEPAKERRRLILLRLAREEAALQYQNSKPT